jgi:hypothetical protein
MRSREASAEEMLQYRKVNAGVVRRGSHFVLILAVRYEAIIFTQTIKLQKEAENRRRRKIIILAKLK